MTGYSKEECLRKACSFLHGKSTEKNARVAIRFALNNRQTFCGDIINYKKSGEIFVNTLLLIPISEDSFIGFQGEHRSWKKRKIDRMIFEVAVLATQIEFNFVNLELELRMNGVMSQRNLSKLVKS